MSSKFRFLLSVLLFCTSQEGFAQFWVKGKVMDKDLKKPIPAANISHKAGNRTVTSDNSGKFEIELSDKKSTLYFSHISFRDTSLNLRNLPWTGDTLFMEVRLDYDLIQIATAEVNALPKPEIIYSNDTLHVGDFLFMGKDLLLLAYEKEDRWKRQEHSKYSPFSECSLVIQDSAGIEINSYSLNGEYISLEKTYNDKIILHSLKKHFLIDISELNFEMAEIDQQTYSNAFVPVLDSVSDFLLLSDYSPDFPAFSYYAFHPSDSSYEEIRKIQDQLQMELLRSEYKYMPTRGKLDAYRMELKTGIDKEIIAAWMTGFSESLYAESLYAPCIIVSDTLCIFNHYNNQLFKHMIAGSEADSLAIEYHINKSKGKWIKNLVHDESGNEIYVQYDKHGYIYLCKLNLNNGTVGEPFRLFYRYPEKIKIRENIVYYLYRPFGSAQKHYLYSEKLR